MLKTDGGVPRGISPLHGETMEKRTRGGRRGGGEVSPGKKPPFHRSRADTFPGGFSRIESFLRSRSVFRFENFPVDGAGPGAQRGGSG